MVAANITVMLRRHHAAQVNCMYVCRYVKKKPHHNHFSCMPQCMAYTRIVAILLNFCVFCLPYSFTLNSGGGGKGAYLKIIFQHFNVYYTNEYM